MIYSAEKWLRNFLWALRSFEMEMETRTLLSQMYLSFYWVALELIKICIFIWWGEIRSNIEGVINHLKILLVSLLFWVLAICPTEPVEMTVDRIMVRVFPKSANPRRWPLPFAVRFLVNVFDWWQSGNWKIYSENVRKFPLFVRNGKREQTILLEVVYNFRTAAGDFPENYCPNWLSVDKY